MRGTTSLRNSRLSRRATALATIIVRNYCSLRGIVGGLTDVVVLHVSSRLLLCFDDFVRLFDKMLYKHLSSHRDDEGGIVGAVRNLIIGVDNLSYTCH